MKTILVPLDGSVVSERALPFVQMLAPESSARIDMLRVITTDAKDTLLANNPSLLHEAEATLDDTPWVRETRIWDMLRYHAAGYLDSQAQPLREGSWEIDVQVQIGEPGERIIATADQIHADLIAMATHGYGAFKRWTHGSTTDDVLHATTTPVLVIPSTVPPARAPRLRRILLALDSTAFSREALPLSTELALQAHAELILFRVVEPPTNGTVGAWLPVEGQMTPREQALHDLQTLAGELYAAGLSVKAITEVGSAAEEIVTAAARHQADLIVMATHGYRGIKRWAYGSVADKVLRAASTPILLVRARSGEA